MLPPRVSMEKHILKKENLTRGKGTEEGYSKHKVKQIPSLNPNNCQICMVKHRTEH